MIDEMNAPLARRKQAPPPFAQTTLAMHFYLSMVIFDKGSIPAWYGARTGRGNDQVVAVSDE